MDLGFIYSLAFWMLLILAALGLALLVFFAWFLALKPPRLELKGCHVLVTGGSRGIGHQVARVAVLKGAKVTILARGKEKLIEVAEELNKLCPESGAVAQWFSVDLVNDDPNQLEKLVSEAQSTFGPIDFLVNNAGGSSDDSFDHLQQVAFAGQIDLNYLSAVKMTRAVLPGMKSRTKGRIVFLSSMAGQIGLFGYTAYSGAKFALRGMAEALQMEVAHTGVYITLVYPPNTDTEAFAVEQASMPRETKLISEAGGLWQPSDVATALLEAAQAGRFSCWFGLDGWMLASLTAGTAPASTPFEIIQQFFLTGLLRVVALFYVKSFYRIVKRCAHRKQE